MGQANLVPAGPPPKAADTALAMAKEEFKLTRHADRVGATVLRLKAEIAKLEEESKVPPSELMRLRAILANAETGDDPDVYWPCVQLAEPRLVAMSGDERRAAALRSYGAEAKEKLAGWRAEAAQALVDRISDPTKPDPDVLQELMWHVHEASQNAHWKRRMLAPRLAWVAVAIALVLLTILLLVRMGAFDAMLGADALGWLLAGLSLGALGALMNVAIGQREGDSRRIPDIRLQWLHALMRILLGAASAVPALLILRGGLGEAVGPAAVGISCFVAGFSERWLLGKIEELGG